MSSMMDEPRRTPFWPSFKVALVWDLVAVALLALGVVAVGLFGEEDPCALFCLSRPAAVIALLVLLGVPAVVVLAVVTPLITAVVCLVAETPKWAGRISALLSQIPVAMLLGWLMAAS